MSHLPTNLQRLRSLIGLSQPRLAEMIGVSRSSYAGYETGRAEPKLDVLVKMADVLGTSADKLLRWDMQHMPDEVIISKALKR